MEKKRSPLQFKFLSAGFFVVNIPLAGSSVVLFKLIALTPVCQFSSLRLLFVVLLVLAGVQQIVIFAGENSELNSKFDYLAMQ